MNVKKVYHGASIVCQHCQCDAKFLGYHDKTFNSLLGRVQFSRPYYYCSDCRQGMFTWDQTLGLTRRKLTPAAAEIITLAGTVNAFVRSRRLLAKMSGLQLSEPTVRRVTEDAGAKLAEAMDNGQLFEPEERWEWAKDVRGRRCGYVGIDGIHVPMQGPGGSRAATQVEYVGRLYNHRGGIAAPDKPHGVDTRYVAGFHSLNETCEHLRQHHDRAGGEEVEEWICITDGGAGIAAALKRTFCWTTWILDFWHAAEYLQELANAMYPRDEDTRTAWMDSWCHALKHEGGGVVLKRLQTLDQQDWSAAARGALTDVTRYFKNQLEGMDYPRYTANGWQIGSGPTEAACKTVISSRLKCSGMRWVQQGANNVSHLRALYLNGDPAWDNFWAPSKN